MTKPDERSRALVWAGGFLVELARDQRLPLDVREQAVRIARHFPTIEQVGHLAGAIAASDTPFGLDLARPEDHPEWAAQCWHGPLTNHSRLAWPGPGLLRARTLEPHTPRPQRLTPRSTRVGQFHGGA